MRESLMLEENTQWLLRWCEMIHAPAEAGRSLRNAMGNNEQQRQEAKVV